MESRLHMTKIKFGTDGWRAIIAKDFTVDNVARVTEATSKWLVKNFKNPSVVLGHDCRFGGELFSETAAKVFIANGIKVCQAQGFISTPMISLGCVKYNTNLGIIITASHNPHTYNGYKIKASYGGPLGPELVQEIEDMIPAAADSSWQLADLDKARESAQLQTVPLEDLYIAQVEKNFDLNAIRNSGLVFAYDAMYGAGMRVMQRLFPDIPKLHCDHNPGFHGQAPEPIHKNLTEFSNFIKKILIPIQIIQPAYFKFAELLVYSAFTIRQYFCLNFFSDVKIVAFKRKSACNIIHFFNQLLQTLTCFGHKFPNSEPHPNAVPLRDVSFYGNSATLFSA